MGAGSPLRRERPVPRDGRSIGGPAAPRNRVIHKLGDGAGPDLAPSVRVGRMIRVLELGMDAAPPDLPELASIGSGHSTKPEEEQPLLEAIQARQANGGGDA